MIETIKERGTAIAAILNRNSELLPPGTRAVAEIQSEKGRKKRGSAGAKNFLASDRVVIYFEPEPQHSEAGRAKPEPQNAANLASARPPIEDLMLALEKAERNPEHAFVSLKWFRDSFLPKMQYPWAADSALRHHWLREAISRRWIVTDRLANPRNPEFPTTSIRINRAMPEVLEILGQSGPGGFGWTPVVIAGEPMSATVLRNRGNY